jgi:hypothetical protein
MNRLPTPDEIISRANAEGHAYVKRHNFQPSQSTTEARLGFEIGCLQREIRTLCDKLDAFKEPPLPARQRSAKVNFGEDVTATVNYVIAEEERYQHGIYPASAEIQAVYIGGQDVLSVLDGDALNVIQERIECGEVVA